MAKYIYPAVFTKENELYSVAFPDIEGCYTMGDSLIDAAEMAKDVLCLMLYRFEEEGTEIPEASGMKSIAVEDNEFVSLITCDTFEYRKFYEKKSVKKTLTLPLWLNTMAERAGVNFSDILQRALKKELNIAD